MNIYSSGEETGRNVFDFCYARHRIRYAVCFGYYMTAALLEIAHD